MNISCIQNLSQTGTLSQILSAHQFCRSVGEYNTNGFEWPRTLLDAYNLEGFRAALPAVEAKAQFDPEGFSKGYVPQTLLWGYDQDSDAIFGLAKVRTILTPALLRHGGHIGLALGQDYRGKGYGTEFFREVLNYCARQGMKDVIVTARHNNFASRLVVEKFNFQLLDLADVVDYSSSNGVVKVARYLIRLED